MTDVPAHVSERLNRSDQRLDGHEKRLTQLEKNEAGMVQWRMGTTKSLESIQSGIQWIFRLIIGGLITAAIAFVIAGGLNGS
ncbi:hemolysin XhlA [Aquimixticola soesokkakensis]|uniref:Hemolysin XhlA n=1 Tax=Aquimixticola soesokkakensis TaxID=1519096 RepID=A0A1Y5SEN7_9RHOB|nr:hemolysin XhlA family protein [Aquimixticola soesokkakensis]SLN38274.1 hemolysin XhlA [Aquimixticola soesokkakensis]